MAVQLARANTVSWIWSLFWRYEECTLLYDICNNNNYADIEAHLLIVDCVVVACGTYVSARGKS